jgi:hypothetical protein
MPVDELKNWGVWKTRSMGGSLCEVCKRKFIGGGFADQKCERGNVASLSRLRHVQERKKA